MGVKSMSDLQGLGAKIGNFKSESEAKIIAKIRPGSEAIVKEDNGTLSLYEITKDTADKIKAGNKSGTSSKVLEFVIDTDNGSIFDRLSFKQNKSESVNQSQSQSKVQASGQLTGYNKPKTTQLASGINYSEFTHKSGKEQETVRAITLSPSSISKLGVSFSRNSNINFEQTAARKDVLAVMNGTFFTGPDPIGKPAGDVVGTEYGQMNSKDISNKEKKGAFTTSERTVLGNIEKRYSFAVDNNGKAVVFRGGVDNSATTPNGGHLANQYKMSLGGGVLLFDKSNTDGKKMYDLISNGNSSYNKQYANLNDDRIIKSGNGGDPDRVAPRSAMGIMSDGSVVIMNASEGKYRKTKGAGMTPYELAKTMKEMGCVTAVMFDGGGAPVMIAKDNKGKTVTHTTPHESDGYGNNKSVIVINK